VLNPEGVPEEIGRIKVLTLVEGDVLRMVSPSGGGFGDPGERDPELVLRDVLDELLTVEDAAAVYKVAVADGRIDEERTAMLRADAVARTEAVVHGAERRRYEEVWPVEASVAFANALLSTPQGIRRTVAQGAAVALKQVRGQLSATHVREAVSRLRSLKPESQRSRTPSG
jgi:N-methylhydantoinase B